MVETIFSFQFFLQKSSNDQTCEWQKWQMTKISKTLLDDTEKFMLDCIIPYSLDKFDKLLLILVPISPQRLE